MALDDVTELDAEADDDDEAAAAAAGAAAAAVSDDDDGDDEVIDADDDDEEEPDVDEVADASTDISVSGSMTGSRNDVHRASKFQKVRPSWRMSGVYSLVAHAPSTSAVNEASDKASECIARG